MALFICGPSFLYPGSEATYFLGGCIDGLTDIDRVYLVSANLMDAAGRVQRMQATLLGPHGTPSYVENGQQWYTIVDAPLWLKFTASPVVSRGTCLLMVVMQGSSGTTRSGTSIAPRQTLTLPLGVRPTPALPQTNGPVPNLALWQSMMTQLADNWGGQIVNPTNTLGEGNWYYDLARVFWQVNDYLQTTKYTSMALASAKAYMDYLSSSWPGGGPSGWTVFPRGLRMTWERTQDSQYLNALLSLKNACWVAYGGDPDCVYARETAYAAMTWVELSKAGQGTDPRLAQCVEFLLSHVDQLFVQERGRVSDIPLDEPFFFGLLAEALIDWFDMTSDPRVIQALKTGCDYLWNHGVDPATGMVLYDLWKPTGDRFCSLNLLMVNAWGFLWRVTGDALYRDQGDILFQHFNDDPGGGITWSSKMFAQNYRSSFDYVQKYRS